MVYAFAVLLVLGAHVLLGDDLLFHSDIWSLIIYGGTAALVVTMGFLALCWPVVFLPAAWKTKLNSALVLTFVVLIATASLRMGLSLITTRKIDPC